MIGHKVNKSELWKNLPWKQFRRSLFRLQVRLYKASRANDIKRVRNLQKLILRSKAARFLAIRQVTQLNQGKKTAGIDGKKSLNFKERFQLSDVKYEKRFQMGTPWAEGTSYPQKGRDNQNAKDTYHEG